MSETTPKDQRGPTNLRIKFRSASLDQFIERYAVDVSAGGIFIRTREPLAVGTQLRLELQLQDATPLLSGEGTVIWIRENDPARPTVPPGMAVRFDKVSPATQPTLDRILAERARLEQAGQLPVPQAGGMAVRRPSTVLPPLESSGRVAAASSNAPTAPVAAPGAGTPDAGGTAPAASPVTKTSFLGSRTPSATGAAPGPFTRARQTNTRPVPVPSALFEPPTAADIDKALSFLEEAPGPAPMPPAPSVPRFVDHEMSNEPTRVGDSSVLAAAASGDDIVELPSDAVERESSGPEAGEARAPGVPTTVEAAATTAERPMPNVPIAPAAPEVSRRFRAASRPYPTLKKRGGTGIVIALIVILGAAAAAVWKLRPGSTVPLTPPSTSAATVAPAAAPATPPPAPQPATPPTPAPAAEAPAPAPAAEKPAATKPAAEKPAETKAAEKSSHEERSSSRHGAHRRGHEEASSARAAAKETAAAKEAAPAEAKPAETPTPAPADNAPAADKPAATDKDAPAAADKPAGDKPAAAKGAVLKITSTPAGADVTIDGSNMGVTPFTSKEVDPTAPHVIRLVKDGFESNERMIGTSDWSRPHGSAPPSLKMNVKLRRTGGAPATDTPKDNAAPADDTGGPYIKEVNPTSP